LGVGVPGHFSDELERNPFFCKLDSDFACIRARRGADEFVHVRELFSENEIDLVCFDMPV